MPQYGLFYENVRACAAQSGLSEEACIARLAGLGMDYLECNWASIRQKPGEFFNYLKACGVGLSVYIFITLDGLLLPAREQPAINELPYIKSLGVRDVMLICFDAERPDPRTSLTFVRLLKQARAYLQAAKELGLTVSFENFDSPRIPCGSCKDLLRCTALLPELRVTLDTGNFQLHGEDVLTCYAALRSRISHVHIKDRATAAKDAPPAPIGKGILPLRRILRDLCQTGYQGGITAELFGIEPTMQNLTEALAFLQE